jgi:hypothetical protein
VPGLRPAAADAWELSSSWAVRGALLERVRPLDMSTGPGRSHAQALRLRDAARMLLSFERPAPRRRLAGQGPELPFAAFTSSRTLKTAQ